MPDVITVMTVTFQSEAKAALRDAIMINRSDTPDTAHPGGQGGIAPVCAGKKTLQPRRRPIRKNFKNSLKLLRRQHQTVRMQFFHAADDGPGVSA